MPMTINRLHKELGKAIEQGWGRKHVCVHKKTFAHPLESDGLVIMPVETAEVESVPMLNEDGGFATRKDGIEIEEIMLVLCGEDDR